MEFSFWESRKRVGIDFRFFIFLIFPPNSKPGLGPFQKKKKKKNGFNRIRSNRLNIESNLIESNRNNKLDRFLFQREEFTATAGSQPRTLPAVRWFGRRMKLTATRACTSISTR